MGPIIRSGMNIYYYTDTASQIDYGCWKYEIIIEKIKCFLHRGLSWFFYDLFIPKPKRYVRHDATPYGFT